MKRARIALTAIGILAVVAGAFAFKARNAGTVYCPGPTPGICTTVAWQTAELPDVATTNRPCGINVLTYYTTTLCGPGNTTTGRVYQTAL